MSRPDNITVCVYCKNGKFDIQKFNRLTAG